MLLLKYLLFAIGAGLLLGAVTLIAWDVFAAIQLRRLIAAGGTGTPRHIRLRVSSRLAAIALLPLLLSQSIAIVPSAMAGVRVNQISGAISGPLGPGVHFVAPLVSSVALYDTREHVFTMAAEEIREPQKKETPAAEAQKPAGVLRVQAKEGLPFGLAIAVRYRLDTKRLEYIHANLPQPIETELVAPAVASAFREVTPNYSVREVFATRREEIREKAARQIVEKLGADGVLVREVLLRDIVLPAEYAKGLEGLLLKAQESERLAYEIEIKQKQVRTAELEAEAEKLRQVKRAEAEKLRQVKRAEAEAQVRVLQAKGEADAMQHTLPLKQKQIEQSRLEAEARKESTLKNAEAAAQAKVIDSKAELEKRKYLADAEANRIRVTSAADADRMKLEALVLKQNPLLIQKIIAERLSDKLQIMMVPNDGKYFFANDVMRSAFGGQMVQPDDPDDAPRKPGVNGQRPPQ